MTIRSDALRWAAGRKIRGGHVVASKLYAPDESWTKEKAWWIQVPVSAVKAGKTIHILCEKDPNAKSFHYLEVPAAFFEQHLDDFATIGGTKINLFLAATKNSWMRDLRGFGKVSFAHFEHSDAAA